MPSEQTAASKQAGDNMTVQIRAATETDVPLILSFIRKLAEYGDISDEVFATEEDIRAALFGPHPVADGSAGLRWQRAGRIRPLLLHVSPVFWAAPECTSRISTSRTRTAAGASARLCWSIWPSWREQRSCGRLEWAVLNWNERAMEFYQDLGAEPMDEWTTFRLGGEALERLASESES